MTSLEKKKTQRHPVVMVVATIILVFGLIITYLGVVTFSIYGWGSLIIIASGVVTSLLAVLTIVTGKPGWILLDLILPG